MLVGSTGLLVGVAGNNVLRLAPPLVIEDSDVREAVSIMDTALGSWEVRELSQAPAASACLGQLVN